MGCVGLLESAQASILLGRILQMLSLHVVQRRQQRRQLSGLLLLLLRVCRADLLHRQGIEVLLLRWRLLLQLHLHGLLRLEVRLRLSCPVWLLVLSRLQVRLQLGFLLDQLCLLLGLLLCLLSLLRPLRFCGEQLPCRQRSRRCCGCDCQAGERCHVLRLRCSLLAGALRRHVQMFPRHAADSMSLVRALTKGKAETKLA